MLVPGNACGVSKAPASFFWFKAIPWPEEMGFCARTRSYFRVLPARTIFPVGFPVGPVPNVLVTGMNRAWGGFGVSYARSAVVGGGRFRRLERPHDSKSKVEGPSVQQFSEIATIRCYRGGGACAYYPNTTNRRL